MPFILSGFDVAALLQILGYWKEDFFDPMAFALMVVIGIPSLILNRISKSFSNMKNFFLLPLIAIGLTFVFSFILIPFEGGDMRGLGWAISVGLGIFFQIAVSILIAAKRSFERIRGR